MHKAVTRIFKWGQGGAKEDTRIYSNISKILSKYTLITLYIFKIKM